MTALVFGVILFLDLQGADIEGLFINIGKDRFCTAHGNSGCGGDKREGRDNNLVARADIRSEQCGMQRRSPVIDRNRMVRTAEIGKFLLEFRDPFARSQHTGFEDSSNSRNFILTDGRSCNWYMVHFVPSKKLILWVKIGCDRIISFPIVQVVPCPRSALQRSMTRAR